MSDKFLKKVFLYMSDVLKCPQIFEKSVLIRPTSLYVRQIFEESVVICPTSLNVRQFFLKCPYMSVCMKSPPISFPIVVICGPALHISPIYIHKPSLYVRSRICLLHVCPYIIRSRTNHSQITHRLGLCVKKLTNFLEVSG
jgi:hypothetical protein